MLDLLITRAALPDGRTNMSVAIQDGRIADVVEGLLAAGYHLAGKTNLPVSNIMEVRVLDPYFYS